jgi:hypothetical protein
LHEWGSAPDGLNLVGMEENSGRRFLPAPKCRGALATTLPTTPAAFTLICPQVVRREWMPLAALARDLGAAIFAAVDVLKRNHDRAISRNHAPATTLRRHANQYAGILRMPVDGLYPAHDEPVSNHSDEGENRGNQESKREASGSIDHDSGDHRRGNSSSKLPLKSMPYLTSTVNA